MGVAEEPRTWIRRDDRLPQQHLKAEDEKVISPWPRFIGVGDGDGKGEDGFVTVTDQASAIKCGVTNEDISQHVTQQYVASGFRRAGLKLNAPWEMACSRYDLNHDSTASSFAMYPMRLERLKSGANSVGIEGECYNGGYLSLLWNRRRMLYWRVFIDRVL